jgi:two-component system response regulator VicR
MPAEETHPEVAPPHVGGSNGEEASRILVVDDHEDNLEVLRLRLESWGYRTDAVSDGAAALRHVEQNPPDLILLDVMMPEVSGIEVAQRI